MTHIEESEAISEAVDLVYALTEDLEPGQVLTHESIGELLGLSPHQGSWDHIVGKVRRRLERSRGIPTWPETSVGYRLLTPSQSLLLIPKKRTARARKQLKRIQRSLRALDEKQLTDHEKTVRRFVLGQVKDDERALRNQQAIHEKLAEPTPSISMRRPLVYRPRQRGTQAAQATP